MKLHSLIIRVVFSSQKIIAYVQLRSFTVLWKSVYAINNYVCECVCLFEKKTSAWRRIKYEKNKNKKKRNALEILRFSFSIFKLESNDLFFLKIELLAEFKVVFFFVPSFVLFLINNYLIWNEIRVTRQQQKKYIFAAHN